MGLLPQRLTTIRFRLRLAYWRSVLAGAALLAFALGVLICSLVDPAQARGAQASELSSLKGKPSQTPTPHRPTVTATPSPTPPATFTPSPTPPAPSTPNPTQPAPVGPSPTAPATDVGDPTATPTATAATTTPTAAATATVIPALGGGSSGGSGDESTPADQPPGLLVWGAVALALLAFSGFLVLEARRTVREEQQRARLRTAQGPARAWLNRGQQAPLIQKAAPQLSAEDAAARRLEKLHPPKPLAPPQETPPTALQPPRWLIDSGLLKERQWEFLTEDPPELEL